LPPHHRDLPLAFSSRHSPLFDCSVVFYAASPVSQGTAPFPSSLEVLLPPTPPTRGTSPSHSASIFPPSLACGHPFKGAPRRSFCKPRRNQEELTMSPLTDQQQEDLGLPSPFPPFGNSSGFSPFSLGRWWPHPPESSRSLRVRLERITL